MNSWTSGSGNLKVEKTKRVVVRAPRRASVTAFVDGCCVGNTGGSKGFGINNLYQHFFHLIPFVENLLHQPLP